MKLVHVAVGFVVAAALPLVAAQASEHRRTTKDAPGAAKGMQRVLVSPAAGEPGHGWQYFSDARQARAVVISPRGDYYYSRGNGLRLVYKASTAT